MCGCITLLTANAVQRVHCNWFKDGDQETPLGSRPVQRAVSATPFVDLQRLDLELQRVKSRDSGWKLLKGRKRDKLLSLLVEKMRQGGKPEAFLESLIHDPSLSTKKDLITKLLLIVSRLYCVLNFPEAKTLHSGMTRISFYQFLLLPPRRALHLR